MTKPSLSDYGTYDESTVPRLWDGVVGAWCPSLGPTGSRLHDFSRFNNWGSLSNMDPATDWVVDGGPYALDFDGVNDSVPLNIAATSIIPSQQPFSVSFWFYLSGAQPSEFGGYLFSDFNSSGTNCSISIRVRSGDTLQAFTNAGATDLISGGLLTNNSWFHAAFLCRSEADKQLFLNGVSVGGSSVSVARSTAGKLAFGAPGEFTSVNVRLNGRMDDVACWNRALTPNEVRELYLLGRGGMFQRRRVRRGYVSEAVNRSYLFVNRGQVIGGGTL